MSEPHNENRPAAPCAVCGAAAFFLLQKDGYSAYRCPVCSLVFIHPLPADEHLKEEVYSSKSGYQGNRKGDVAEFIAHSYNGRFDDTLDYLDEHATGKKILDVGCSNGEFLYLARQRGYEPHGVELNRKTAEAGIRSGLDIFVGFLEDAGFSGDSFDAVTLNDVIEHVSDPKKLLAECRRVLKPGGLLIIRTPNLDCFWPRITFFLYRVFGIPWSSITPPHHLHYFSVGNMELLLEKLSLSTRYVWFHPAPPLRYELGSLHLYKRYKRERSLSALAFMLASFSIYTVLRGLDAALSPFKMSDFEMTLVSQKRHETI